MVVTVPMGVPLFLAACAIFGAVGTIAAFDAGTWGWLSAAGVIHFVAGRYGNYRATRALGAALSGPIQQLSVPVALALALLFLDEKLTPLRVIGILMVVLGPMVIFRRGKGGGREKTASGFEPDYVDGTVWGAVGAFGYGTSPLLIAYALEGRGLVDSLAAGFVSYLAAAIVVLAMVPLPGNARHVMDLDRTAARWFALSGFIVFFSQLFRYMALAIAPVSVVTPIQRLSVVFRLLFAALLNRDHEILGLWTWIGIAISALGAIALSVSTDLVLQTVPMPGWLADVARIEWP
jgi:drug/metabolite transporter (DMT)-like permease